jgi:transposase
VSASRIRARSFISKKKTRCCVSVFSGASQSRLPILRPRKWPCSTKLKASKKRRGKRKPLPADLPRIEVIHELPEHELTCACGCRKHAIGEEISEQLEIVPMQIRVIKLHKVYGCRDCETAPVTAAKPAHLIEKSMASPSVLAMLLTTKYVDGLPLHRFEKVLGRHGVDIPRQTLARWVIQCGEHLQPLLNLMRDRLLESRVIHCDETRV